MIRVRLPDILLYSSAEAEENSQPEQSAYISSGCNHQTGGLEDCSKKIKWK